MDDVQQELFDEILKEVKQVNRLKKQIEYENTIITALNLCRQERFSNNLFQVTVKVFNSILDIQDHLNSAHFDNDINSFETINGFVYLLEIKIVEEILEKLILLNSEINVFITNETKSINKCTKFKKLLNHNQHNIDFQIIVPFSSNKLSSFVEIKLLVPLDNISLLPNIVLCRTHIGISYFLKIFEGPFNTKTLNRMEILRSISRLYLLPVESNLTDEYFSRDVKFTNEKRFIEYLLKNSYHRCELNILKKLTKPDLEKIVSFNMQIGKYDFVKVQFDFKKKILSIRGKNLVIIQELINYCNSFNSY